MAKGPTLDELLAAKKVILEYEFWQEHGGEAATATSDRLYTNQEVAEELGIGVSSWHALKRELDIAPVAKRGKSPLFSQGQVDQAKDHQNDEGD